MPWFFSVSQLDKAWTRYPTAPKTTCSSRMNLTLVSCSSTNLRLQLLLMHRREWWVVKSHFWVSCVTGMCDPSHSAVWPEPQLCVTGATVLCDLSHSTVWPEPQPCVTLATAQCDLSWVATPCERSVFNLYFSLFLQQRPDECSMCLSVYDKVDRRSRTLPCGRNYCSCCLCVLLEDGLLTCCLCMIDRHQVGGNSKNNIKVHFSE